MPLPWEPSAPRGWWDQTVAFLQLRRATLITSLWSPELPENKKTWKSQRRETFLKTLSSTPWPPTPLSTILFQCFYLQTQIKIIVAKAWQGSLRPGVCFVSMTSQRGITDLISLSLMIGFYPGNFEAPAQYVSGYDRKLVGFLGRGGDQLWGVGDKKRKPVGGLPPD